MAQVIDWGTTAPKWTKSTLQLLVCDIEHNTPNVNLNELTERSSSFPRKFPIVTVLCSELKNDVAETVLERNINSVYPVIHEKVLFLCAEFLIHKRAHGNSIEKSLYKDMDVLGLVERLISKRAVAFVGVRDSHMLLDGSEGIDKWKNIGTNLETDDMNLKKYMSYDELKLSAFLSVSSFTHFINNGNRHNCGTRVEKREEIEDEGIIVGLIGPRLHRSEVMEFRDIIITRQQNTAKHGFLDFFTRPPPTVNAVFASFYEKPDYTYDQIVKEYERDPDNFPNEFEVYFDNKTYEKRLALSIDTFFVEANERAKLENKMAFLHVVGIGLGVWRAFNHQKKLFLDICARRIE